MLPFKPLLDLADQFGILEVVVKKVKESSVNQPEEAVSNFITALEEIYRLYTATDTEIARYLSISLSPTDDNANELEKLNLLEGNTLSLRWNKARGHCHRINNIYDKFLDKWLSNLLNKKDNDALQRLFSTFAEVEGGFVDNLSNITAWLSNEASQVLNHFFANDFDEANKSVRIARKELLPVRRSMSKAMAQMLEIENSMIEATGYV